jgi:hypothetical protein
MTNSTWYHFDYDVACTDAKNGIPIWDSQGTIWGGGGFMINITPKEHNNRHHYHVYRITAGGSLFCRGVKEE